MIEESFKINSVSKFLQGFRKYDWNKIALILIEISSIDLLMKYNIKDFNYEDLVELLENKKQDYNKNFLKITKEEKIKTERFKNMVKEESIDLIDDINCTDEMQNTEREKLNKNNIQPNQSPYFGEYNRDLQFNQFNEAKNNLNYLNTNFTGNTTTNLNNFFTVKHLESQNKFNYNKNKDHILINDDDNLSKNLKLASVNKLNDYTSKTNIIVQNNVVREIIGSNLKNKASNNVINHNTNTNNQNKVKGNKKLKISTKSESIDSSNSYNDDIVKERITNVKLKKEETSQSKSKEKKKNKEKSNNKQTSPTTKNKNNDLISANDILEKLKSDPPKVLKLNSTVAKGKSGDNQRSKSKKYNEYVNALSDNRTTKHQTNDKKTKKDIKIMEISESEKKEIINKSKTSTNYNKEKFKIQNDIFSGIKNFQIGESNTFDHYHDQDDNLSNNLSDYEDLPLPTESVKIINKRIDKSKKDLKLSIPDDNFDSKLYNNKKNQLYEEEKSEILSEFNEDKSPKVSNKFDDGNLSYYNQKLSNYYNSTRNAKDQKKPVETDRGKVYINTEKDYSKTNTYGIKTLNLDKIKEPSKIISSYEENIIKTTSSPSFNKKPTSYNQGYIDAVNNNKILKNSFDSSLIGVNDSLLSSYAPGDNTICNSF